VGEEMARCLRQSRFFEKTAPVLFARSAREISIDNLAYSVQATSEEALQRFDIVFFAGGDGASEEFAPALARRGILCIDNSSVFRMNPDVPLIVPEVNPGCLSAQDKLIANPNCSTIQLVVALWPLHQAFGLKRVIVSTYQAVSGTGRAALDELALQERETTFGDQPSPPKVYPRRIYRNVFPENGAFDAQGYTTEETKLLFESRKILGLPQLEVVATSVRVPTEVGHGESVWAKFERPCNVQAALELLRAAPGLSVPPSPTGYVTPVECAGRDEVFVGRLRQDPFDPCALTFWICADNLRKGAALNAVQIAELALAKGFIECHTVASSVD
jgi:aspartate-semialdehyde dehydrogenase